MKGKKRQKGGGRVGGNVAAGKNWWRCLGAEGGGGNKPLEWRGRISNTRERTNQLAFSVG